MAACTVLYSSALALRVYTVTRLLVYSGIGVPLSVSGPGLCASPSRTTLRLQTATHLRTSRQALLLAGVPQIPTPVGKALARFELDSRQIHLRPIWQQVCRHALVVRKPSSPLIRDGRQRRVPPLASAPRIVSPRRRDRRLKDMATVETLRPPPRLGCQHHVRIVAPAVDAAHPRVVRPAQAVGDNCVASGARHDVMPPVRVVHGTCEILEALSGG